MTRLFPRAPDRYLGLKCTEDHRDLWNAWSDAYDAAEGYARDRGRDQSLTQEQFNSGFSERCYAAAQAQTAFEKALEMDRLHQEALNWNWQRDCAARMVKL